MNPFTLTTVRQAENNISNVIFSSTDKKETNKELRRLVKSGEIVKRGYSYFLTFDISVRVDRNY